MRRATSACVRPSARRRRLNALPSVPGDTITLLIISYQDCFQGATYGKVRVARLRRTRPSKRKRSSGNAQRRPAIVQSPEKCDLLRPSEGMDAATPQLRRRHEEIRRRARPPESQRVPPNPGHVVDAARDVRIHCERYVGPVPPLVVRIAIAIGVTALC